MALTRDVDTLPIELFGEIFKHVSHSYLPSCTLLSRSLYPIAQRYLFYRVSLVMTRGPMMNKSRTISRLDTSLEHCGSPAHFLELLSKSPHIAQFVCRLHIYITDLYAPHVNILQFSTILTRIPNLVALAFPVVMDPFEYTKEWYTISETKNLLSIISSALAHGTLVELDVSNISTFVPLSVWVAGPRPPLRRLVLQYITSNDSISTGSTGNRPSIPLQSVSELALLHLNDYSVPHSLTRVAQWLKSPGCLLYLKSVERLEIRIFSHKQLAGEGADEILRLFPDVHTFYFQPSINVTLRFFKDTVGIVRPDINSTVQKSLEYVPESLARMRRLRQFIVHIELFRESSNRNDRDSWFGSGLVFAAALLQTISNVNSISTLTLILEMQYIFYKSSYMKLAQQIPTWMDIVDLLTSGSFPMLRVVELELFVHRLTEQRDRADMREQLRCVEALQRLRDNNISVVII